MPHRVVVEINCVNTCKELGKELGSLLYSPLPRLSSGALLIKSVEVRFDIWRGLSRG